jgi:RNA polymerase sigma factor (sigma-70 family)
MDDAVMDDGVDFEAHRAYLRAVAYRMLGSATEADDALQEAWLRLARADTDRVRDARAWLTTVVARVCVDMLRARVARRETPLDSPVPATDADPEEEAVLADSVGVALLVVLDRLTPAERLAFVLHDLFALPFEEVAPILGRSVPAAKMLASRARHRLRTAEALDADAARQRGLVAAFLTASRDGDFAALLDLLDPDATVRADATAAGPGGPRQLRGARDVAGQALAFGHQAAHARTGVVEGRPAILVAPRGTLVTVLLFTIVGDRIAAIDIVADPERLAALA